MKKGRRSGCPISVSLELFGDRWSLLVLRDILFGSRRYYGEFLDAGEGISTNILAERLERLEAAGLLTRTRDPADRKRHEYGLTEKGLDTLPILIEMILWGAMHDPETAAPPEFLRRIRTDREGLIEEIRSRWS
jgi:DNA-binding HxlR family transcriptional regulator